MKRMTLVVEAFAHATLEKMEAEIDSIPAAHRPAYLAYRSAERLYKMIAMEAPEIIIEAERKLLVKRAGELPCYEEADRARLTSPPE